ncbi:MAG: dicarboxylate/amino acid:cation symporter [Bacteroidaceae bacterium]|nr:dicarboxylate/amino acid:cation symporter [Bacteroidaceae bacterium]MBQ5817977.1 dicarboxylate/amino acid:cation symporter [Bacteroidaceae bacterium]
MKIKKIPLLAQIIVAIILGVVCGMIFPEWLSKIFATINGIFSNLLSFIIPLLILGLIAPGIADVGKNAGRLLAATAAVAYLFTLFSGFFTFFVCEQIYPSLIAGESLNAIEESATTIAPYFTIEMPPLFGVMSALIAAFLLGVGMTAIKGTALRSAMDDFKSIIVMSIEKIIVPFLPIYIFGIFLSMTQSGQIAGIFAVFIKIIVVIFAITVIILLLQYCVAGAVSKRNPLKMLRTMMVAYFTALGTQSSAATIPVTLAQTKKNGVREDIADFVIPLCATIHLSGSTLKIVACALAIMMLSNIHYDALTMAGFICMLGITMVAAPGVPGGAIMASLGILETMLGFDQTALGLMIALYIAMDSFGTATNVTGDCAVAAIIETLDKKTSDKGGQ